ncbi:hypothetical protein TWF751_006280, partial [Orbilia oligospora]
MCLLTRWVSKQSSSGSSQDPPRGVRVYCFGVVCGTFIPTFRFKQTAQLMACTA